MSTPYWGQLPPSKARRTSVDYDQTVDRRLSLDQPSSQSQSLAQSRSNRAPVQTTLTDVRTESTFSPLEPPVTPNFKGAGPAPRSSSLPYGQDKYLPEPQERPRRRTTRAEEDYYSYDEIAASPPPPPAAPDVPRAPPVSYKDPYRHSSPAFTPAYTYNADGSPGPPISAYRFSSPRFSSPQARIAAMEAESFYKDATPPSERRTRAPMLDRTRQTFDEAGGAMGRFQGDAERSGSMHRPIDGDVLETEDVEATPPKRQGTLQAPSKRPTWADDRSPLQRLELTLDSITKEEKRARVEAAEFRARERAARRESAENQERFQSRLEPPTSQPTRVRVRRQSEVRHEEPRVTVADPTTAAPNGPLSQHVPEEPKQHVPSNQPPGSRIPVAKNRNVSATEKADPPQGNLSFRERAAKDNINLPRDAGDNSPASPASPSSGGFALTRSGSNKLKKNPPGDPWYNARKEAEEKSATFSRRNSQREAANESSRDVAVAPTAAKPRNGVLTKRPPSPEYGERPPARGKQLSQEGKYEEPQVRTKGLATAIGPSRAESTGNSQQIPMYQHPYQTPVRNAEVPETPVRNAVKYVKFPDRKHEAQAFDDEEYDSDANEHRFGIHDYMYRGKLRPGRGMYQPPKYLEEWKTAMVGMLSGSLLDLNEEPNPFPDKNTPWWENTSGRRRSSTTTRPKSEAFGGAYEDTKGPTRFNPPLYLKCGPLLRYCGLRYETPAAHNDAATTQEIWRGTVMIVTQDSESSYEIPPILRLFVQPIELLPPPPSELRGGQTLPPEYVDPIAGIPKLGRRGETLYVRPVEHLEEAKDVSRLEPDDGLFEITRTAPDFDNAPDPPGSFASRKRRTQVDGEKLGKYKDVRGFRLHAERGHTFWRFNIEVELRDHQQRIAYRINQGSPMAFWIPARGQTMNIMFYSCNGFSLSVNPDDFSGPDPMWRDVLNNHQTRPFHVMLGGGDQLYNDAIIQNTRHFHDWLEIKNPLHKNNAPLIPELQDEMEQFYLDRYMMWFSQGLFGLANCQIPMVNMYDDHDIIDGFGSYPHHFMKSPVFSGLGNVAFKYYMLFQHQSLPEETEETEPSWVLGVKPGPYIRELSRSTFMFLGSKVALLAVDCRTERTRDEVVRKATWRKLMDRCYDEIIKGQTQHLLVLLGVPIAYPRLVWLENILTSRIMDPIKALGKAGMLGNFLNRFDGGVEVLDDLDDHWTAKNHKVERRYVIEDLQDLAGDKSVRVTILSGDVHLAAIGQFYSNAKEDVAKHHDFRYIPNIISSAIANTPPPDIMADILNKRNKVHHFDKKTDEDMIPIFTSGVDGKPRNNKRLLPHRNWCSIREYVPGDTPPPTPPPPEEYEDTPEATPPGSRGRGGGLGLFRRFSLSRNKGSAASRALEDRSRPPLSGGGFMRSFSRRASSDAVPRAPGGGLFRSLSLGRIAAPSSSSRARGPAAPAAFTRRRSVDRPDDGGINGSWGVESDEDEEVVYEAPRARRARASTVTETRTATAAATYAQDYSGGTNMGRLRGGGADRNDEYEVGDDSYFTARPARRANTQPVRSSGGGGGGGGEYYDYSPSSNEQEEGGHPTTTTTAYPAPQPAIRPFHRTPTGLTAKQIRAAGGAARYEVDLEGGLDVCLNVEVNARDPAGITVPYRLLVPRLWYEYEGEEPGSTEEEEDDDIDNDELKQGHGQGPPPPQPQPQPQQQQQQHTVYDGIVRGEEGEDEDYYDDDGIDAPGDGHREKRPGVLKRLFSGRGSQYRAHRQP